MDKDLFERALQMTQYNQILYKVSLSAKTKEFFSDFKVPEESVAFFERYSYHRIIRFKNVFFHRVNELPEDNLCEENRRCIADKLLIIGSGLNGDLIVLDLLSLQVGYLCQDNLWGNDAVKPRDILISLNCTPGRFFYDCVNTGDCPVDAHQAKEYMHGKVCSQT